MQTETINPARQDEQAVAAVRRGDAERYRELVERHERRVFAVAWSRLGDATLAEEATQEAFIRGYRRLWLLGDGAKFAGWITSIARNAAINLGLRHRRELNKRERWALEQPAATSPTTGETTEFCTPETLRQTLAELPAAHRECLVLFYLEGKSGTEAAVTLGISETAFRVRLHRARGVLREQLEAKLEGSLAKLRPPKTLVPAVMAAILVSSSAKAATAGGTVAVAKLLPALGKTFLLSWLVSLISIIGTLPGLGFAWFVGRVERGNFRDTDGFRPQLHRQFFRSFLWGFPLLLMVMAVINHSAFATWGINGQQLFTVCFLLVVTLISARSLTISRNPFQIGMFAYCVIITVGISALALGWIPRSLSQLPLLAATMLFFLIFKKRPARMDYSLFLRAAHGLLKFSDEADDAPQSNRFDRRSLLAFARFLGSRFLVNNFHWETNGLVLRLPAVGNRFLTNMASLFMPPISQNCSHISLGWDGTVSAHCGKTDSRDLSALKTGRMADPRELECVVAEVVGHAWREFRDGKLTAAERALGELPESDIFVVSPARAKSTRWWRIFIGASVVLMMAGMVGQLLLPNHSQSSFRLKPVELTTAQVRYALEQKAAFTNFDEATKFGDNLTPVFNLVLPPTNLMSAETMEKMRALFLENFKPGESNSSTRVQLLLGTEILQKAVVNDWFTKEQLGLTDEIIRQTITNASKQQKRLWFDLQPTPTVTSEVLKDGTVQHKPVSYTVLMTDRLALNVQCLDKLGCLDVVEDKSVAETLLQHQILTGQTPPGRRPMPDTKPLHGLFFTTCYDPIRDTYESLVVLEKLGRLNQVNQEACVEGILRFHRGGGLFASPNKDDGLVIFGDARDTIAAFESLRILGALDRVKDLDKWKFRPNFTSRMLEGVKQRLATWDEIEAWVCRQRLEKILRERKESPQSPVRSLLDP
jgi:RNA polymerase sigma-70 factor (ECF subfamily)